MHGTEIIHQHKKQGRDTKGESLPTQPNICIQTSFFAYIIDIVTNLQPQDIIQYMNEHM